MIHYSKRFVLFGADSNQNVPQRLLESKTLFCNFEEKIMSAHIFKRLKDAIQALFVSSFKRSMPLIVQLVTKEAGSCRVCACLGVVVSDLVHRKQCVRQPRYCDEM